MAHYKVLKICANNNDVTETKINIQQPLIIPLKWDAVLLLHYDVLAQVQIVFHLRNL